MVIILQNGPLQGTIHECEPGFPVPDQLALLDDDGNRHWYRTLDGKWAEYVKTEDRRDVRIEQLERAFRHTHVAGEGKNIDWCKTCGMNFRDPIHKPELRSSR